MRLSRNNTILFYSLRYCNRLIIFVVVIIGSPLAIIIVGSRSVDIFNKKVVSWLFLTVIIVDALTYYR